MNESRVIRTDVDVQALLGLAIEKVALVERVALLEGLLGRAREAIECSSCTVADGVEPVFPCPTMNHDDLYTDDLVAEIDRALEPLTSA